MGCAWCLQGLPGLRIRCGGSAAAVRAWSADTPPPLAATGPSHFWGLLPRWLFSDIVIRPDPVTIAHARRCHSAAGILRVSPLQERATLR